LILRILRSRHSARHTAWASSIGLFVACTPTVGLQMPAVFLIWLSLRFCINGSPFNLPVALAWTWTSNAFTVPVFYYTFFLTGSLVLGGDEGTAGFSAFADRLLVILSVPSSFSELSAQLDALWTTYGAPLFLGSIPWAFLAGFVGYYWTLKLIERFQMRRRPVRVGSVSL